MLTLAKLRAIMPMIMPTTATSDSHHCTCLGHLGWCDRDRNDPYCQGKLGRRYSDVISQAFSYTNLANVNEP